MEPEDAFALSRSIDRILGYALDLVGESQMMESRRRTRVGAAGGAAYYQGMAALLEIEATRERISRRELYRRCAQIGEVVVDVAERIQYAIVKQT